MSGLDHAGSTGGLQITGLATGYGKVQVVSDFSVTVSRGEVVALVGRNGAGKSTALAATVGLRFGPTTGTVQVDSADLSRAAPNAVVVAGISLVPEGRRIFRDMSVIENLRLGAFTKRRSDRRQISDYVDEVYQLFPVLARFSRMQAGTLSGGQQQMVAIGQALMSRPDYLLLDEPASGVAPVLVDEIYDTLERLVADGLGLLLVDQSVERVLERSTRYYVMDGGAIVLNGTSTTEAIDRINPILLGTEPLGSS